MEDALGLPRPPLPPQLTTDEEILRYLREAIDDAKAYRKACDVYAATATLVTAREQQRRAHSFVMYFGAAQGAITLALRMRRISPSTFDELIRELRETLMATDVGRF